MNCVCKTTKLPVCGVLESRPFRVKILESAKKNAGIKPRKSISTTPLIQGKIP